MIRKSMETEAGTLSKCFQRSYGGLHLPFLCLCLCLIPLPSASLEREQGVFGLGGE